MDQGAQPLSEREMTVLELAAAGQADKQIAAQMGVALATVRTYWERIRSKLGAINRGHAIALGMPHNRVELAAGELEGFVDRGVSEEAITLVDDEGHFLTWNEGVKKLFGYSEAEWVGSHNTIIFIPTEKHDAFQELKDANKAGISLTYRWHLRKDKSKFWGANMVIRLPSPGPAPYAKIIRPKPDSGEPPPKD